MRRNTRGSCVPGLSIVLLAACAGNTAQDTEGASADILVAEVSAMVERYFELGNAGEFEEAFATFRDPSGAADGQLVPNWEQHKRSSVLPFLQGLGGASFNLEEFSVYPVGEDVVVVVGRYEFSAQRDGAPISNPRTAFTWVVHKAEQDWMVRHWHTSTP